jgi:hypothetical protein
VTRQAWKDRLVFGLAVLVTLGGPAAGIAVAVAADDPAPQRQAAAPAPQPAPTTPPPVPEYDPATGCLSNGVPDRDRMAECQRQLHGPDWCDPMAPDYWECDRRRIDRITREALRDTERHRGLRPGGGGGSWSPRGPSSPRPIQPYPALPGDPNDRDHDGRACESGCIN